MLRPDGGQRRAREPAQPSPAWWQSGHAAACKAVYAGSIPTQASKNDSSAFQCAQKTRGDAGFFVSDPRRGSDEREVTAEARAARAAISELYRIAIGAAFPGRIDWT